MYNDCSVYSYMGKNKCIQFNSMTSMMADIVLPLCGSLGGNAAGKLHVSCQEPCCHFSF